MQSSLRIMPVLCACLVLAISACASKVQSAVPTVPTVNYTLINPTISIEVNPNPAYANHTVTVTITLSMPPPTKNDTYMGIYLAIFEPDGTYAEARYFTSTTGKITTDFIPRYMGNYTLQAKFNGQTFFSSHVQYASTSTSNLALTVQEEPEPSPSPTPTTEASPSPTSTKNPQANDSQDDRNTGDTEPEEGGSIDTVDEVDDSNLNETASNQRRDWLPGTFPVFETVLAGMIAFIVCVATMLVFKRWD